MKFLIIFFSLSTMAKTTTIDGKQYQCKLIDTCKPKIIYKTKPVEKIVYKDKVIYNTVEKKVFIPKERIIYKELKPEEKKNILSLSLVSSENDLSYSSTKHRADVYNERQIGVGFLYQRILSRDIVVGVEIDTNENYSIKLGFRL